MPPETPSPKEAEHQRPHNPLVDKALDAIQPPEVDPKAEFAKHESRMIEDAWKRQEDLVTQAAGLPDSPEKNVILEMVRIEAPKHYQAIQQKYAKLREVSKTCQRIHDVVVRNMNGTEKERKELDILEVGLGLGKLSMQTFDALNKKANDVFNSQLELIRLAKDSSTESATQRATQIQNAVRKTNYDFSGADAAHEAAVGNTDKWEGRLNLADEGMRRLVRGIPWGPEVYEGFRSVGEGIGSGDFKGALAKLPKRYAETKAGPGGRIGLEVVEHHEEIRKAAKDADKLAEVMDDLHPYLEEYGMDAAEQGASPLLKKIVQKLAERKYPKLAAVKVIVEELLQGATATEALGKSKKHLKRAAKVDGGKLAEQATDVAVSGATSTLESTDTKITKFRAKFNDLTKGKLESEVRQILVDELVEEYTAQLKQKAEGLRQK